MEPTASDLQLMSDAALIVASGQYPQAFGELYERWAEAILTYFYRRTRVAEVSADLMAETFAVAYQRRGSYRDQQIPGGAGLYGIARRELSHYLRHREVERRALKRLQIDVPMIDRESAEALAGLLDVDDRMVDLELNLDRLTDADRQVLELRVVDELGYAEIATQLGISGTAARVRLHRALGRLKELTEVKR